MLSTPASDLSYLVVGGESPELVALAIAINLIIALAGESAINANAQLITLREIMVPCGIKIGFMVSHAVDGDLDHLFLLRVILIV